MTLRPLQVGRGPLINRDGQVIGVTFAVVRDFGAPILKCRYDSLKPCSAANLRTDLARHAVEAILMALKSGQ
jgi:hypothetical protein